METVWRLLSLALPEPAWAQTADPSQAQSPLIAPLQPSVPSLQLLAHICRWWPTGSLGLWLWLWMWLWWRLCRRLLLRRWLWLCNRKWKRRARLHISVHGVRERLCITAYQWWCMLWVYCIPPWIASRETNQHHGKQPSQDDCPKTGKHCLMITVTLSYLCSPCCQEWFWSEICENPSFFGEHPLKA